MLLQPTRIKTDEYRITYDKAENLIVAEDSSLPRPSRIYYDACDVGYIVISHRTGREVIYVDYGMTGNSDGDILYWDYKPIDRRDEGLPTLRVFND